MLGARPTTSLPWLKFPLLWVPLPLLQRGEGTNYKVIFSVCCGEAGAAQAQLLATIFLPLPPNQHLVDVEVEEWQHGMA